MRVFMMFMFFLKTCKRCIDIKVHFIYNKTLF